MTDSAVAALRWVVDRRPDLPPIGDQGRRPTCLSFAATTAHEHGHGAPLSVEHLHWACERRHGGSGTLRALSATLNADGQAPESQWPYNPMGGYETADRPPAAVVGPFSCADVALVDHDIENVEQELVAGRVPVVALRVSTSFHEATGGVVDEPAPGTDGHAVVAVGVVEVVGAGVGSLRAGDRLVLVRNSWGPGWGVDGYALVSSRAWRAIVFAAVTVNPTAVAA